MGNKKNKLKFTVLLALIFSLFGVQVIYASNTADDIYIHIDGTFDDWDAIGTLVYNDQLTPNSTSELKMLKAFLQDNNLYLYVERWQAGNTADSFWELQIPFLENSNLSWGRQVHILPWSSERVRVPTVGAYMYQDDFNNKNIVEVSFWSYFNTSYSVSEDFTKVEFVIPLNILDIDSTYTDIVFAINSITEEGLGDWIPRTGPLLIAGGPIFGSFTPIVIILFLGVWIHLLHKKIKLNYIK
jgi:hypothetical protein